jgi:hypothetical protein
MLFFDKLNAKMKKHVAPPTKAQVFALFIAMDVDRSGELSKNEFHELMGELCKNVSNGGESLRRSD